MRIVHSAALALMAVLVPALADEAPQMRVAASPARVDIEPGAAGLRLIELPDLEFRLSIEPDCAGGEAESLSVSVADSSEELGAAALAGRSAIDAELRLPAKQSAPLPVNRFCPADAAPKSLPAMLQIRDAFTAHLSLRCVRDGRQSIVYSTVPLSLDLYCKIPDDHTDAPGQDDDVAGAADSPPRY
ncbi:MAG: hypothetical protein WB812_01950 [Woeseiaceae bacterium]